MVEKTIHRIDAVRKDKNLTTKDLEIKLEYSNGAYAKALKSSASTKDELILKFLEVFPEVNLTWLITGEGEMYGCDNPYEADRLAHYLVENHESLMKESVLYREKIMNLVKDEHIKYLTSRMN